MPRVVDVIKWRTVLTSRVARSRSVRTRARAATVPAHCRRRAAAPLAGATHSRLPVPSIHPSLNPVTLYSPQHRAPITSSLGLAAVGNLRWRGWAPLWWLQNCVYIYSATIYRSTVMWVIQAIVVLSSNTFYCLNLVTSSIVAESKSKTLLNHCTVEKKSSLSLTWNK